ncbi:unnamed protein product [Prorocentrum cordatum]|uniref:Uncharacterized protein n=1 Tax=Prorocentrum cordatum TaxID=2364126 RepID=A0ABN9QKG9_9DINO|nr:unnamed protein product [Polarella glacialis]
MHQGRGPRSSGGGALCCLGRRLPPPPPPPPFCARAGAARHGQEWEDDRCSAETSSAVTSSSPGGAPRVSGLRGPASGPRSSQHGPGTHNGHRTWDPLVIWGLRAEIKKHTAPDMDTPALASARSSQAGMLTDYKVSVGPASVTTHD